MVDGASAGWAVGNGGTIIRIPSEITPQYLLTINVDGSGTTSYSSGWYTEGDNVSPTAQPDTGWSFDHWELDGVNVGDMNPYTVMMDTDHTLTAVFVADKHSLTITVDGSGTTDPASGSYQYDAGSIVEVDAQAATGWSFDHWELDGVNVGSAASYSVTMDDDYTLTAIFKQDSPPSQPIYYDLMIGIEESGTTTPSPGSHTYTEGSTVVVDAQPDAGWMLNYWELDGVNIGSTDPYTVTMNTDHTLIAVFEKIPQDSYVLTIAITGSGTTTPAAGTHLYTVGSTVTVTAQDTVTDWSFDHWELDGVNVGDANPYTVTMDADHALTAIFEEEGIVDIIDPIAVAGSDQTVTSGTNCVFDGGGSSDSVGIVTYEWDFGDDTTGTGRVTTHTYATAGTYTVTLTVWDAAGNFDVDALTVTIQDLAPTVEWWMLALLFIGISAIAVYVVRSR
jgi:hypothetical protein